MKFSTANYRLTSIKRTFGAESNFYKNLKQRLSELPGVDEETFTKSGTISYKASKEFLGALDEVLLTQSKILKATEAKLRADLKATTVENAKDREEKTYTKAELIEATIERADLQTEFKELLEDLYEYLGTDLKSTDKKAKLNRMDEEELAATIWHKGNWNTDESMREAVKKLREFKNAYSDENVDKEGTGDLGLDEDTAKIF